MKTCKDCKRELPLDRFPNAKAYAGGKRPRCTPCHALAAKGYRDKLDTATRRNYRMRHTYGISEEEYQAKLKELDNCCEICGDKQCAPLHVDHCHASGQVRGYLCKHCNTGLGHFKDKQDVLFKAITYLIERG
jgi:hypothetical protein